MLSTNPQKSPRFSSVCTCVVVFLLGFFTHYFLTISLSTNALWLRHPRSSSSSNNRNSDASSSSSSSATMRSSNSSSSSSATATRTAVAVANKNNHDDEMLTTSDEHTNNNNVKKFCSDENRCIFDIGHNTGQDTLFYLSDSQSRDMRILAVDANPQLINASVTRFASAIASNNLRLLNTGLVGEPSSDSSSSTTTTTKTSTSVSSSIKSDTTLTFWVNDNDKFSSFRESGGCRDGYARYRPSGDHTFCHPISVPTRTCASLIREYGTPVYMKIDIEGFDGVCVRSVATLPIQMRPRYMSVENVHKTNINLLESLGYKWFKAVCQLHFQWNKENPKLNGMSGPWGERARDYERGEDWLTADEIRSRLPLPSSVTINGVTRRGWYDIHASK